MKSKLFKLLAGKASKKEKIQLLLAFLGSSSAVLTALVIVVASLLLRQHRLMEVLRGAELVSQK